MRANRIRATWRELERQPLVTALFVLAAICVIVRTALLSVPELFSDGAAIGDVVYDLAIAYVAAWVFYLLVVILPRLRDRERILEGAGQVIGRLCALGLRMTSELGMKTGEFQDLADAGQVELFSLRLRDLSNTEESSIIIIGADGSRPASWHEWTVHKALKAGDLYQSLVPYFVYFESELIQFVNKVALSSFVDQGRELAGVRVTGGNMSGVARQLAEFITACRELRAYYDTQVIMQDSPHDDSIVGEVVTTV
jgi:hypothetical protein